jgi:hypothetical protein
VIRAARAGLGALAAGEVRALRLPAAGAFSLLRGAEVYNLLPADEAVPRWAAEAAAAVYNRTQVRSCETAS